VGWGKTAYISFYALFLISPAYGFSLRKCMLALVHPFSPPELKKQELKKVDPNSIVGKILSLEERYKKGMEKNNCSWTSNHCRGGSGLLKRIIKDELNIDTEAVANQFHTFLVIKNFYPDGGMLIIDPTIQQFFKQADVPVIFVGSADSLKTFFESHRSENDSRFTLEKFLKIQPDLSVPDYTP
jgi:hypothetical protein